MIRFVQSTTRRGVNVRAAGRPLLLAMGYMSVYSFDTPRFAPIGPFV